MRYLRESRNRNESGLTCNSHQAAGSPGRGRRGIMDFGLAVLRLVVGLTLAAHGVQKLFGWFGGPGLHGTGRGLEQLGFVPGRRSALLAGLTEAGGGLLLTLGLATPAAAAAV